MSEQVKQSFISHIITLLLILSFVCSLAASFNSILRFASIVQVAVLIMTFFYLIFGFKKNRKNALKNVMFLFAMFVIILTLIGYRNFPVVQILSCIAAALVMYICGRLNKLEKNKECMIVIAVLLFVSGCLKVYTIENGSFFVEKYVGLKASGMDVSLHQKITGVVNQFSILIVWITLSLGYVFRYKNNLEVDINE